MEERRQYGFRVRPNYGQMLGYFFFFFESQHGDMSSDGNMLAHGVSVDATPRYVYLHGEWRMLLI